MKKLIIELAMLLGMMMSIFQQAYSQERHTDLRLDCGASKETPITDFQSWLPDEDYIKSGKNYTLTYTQNFSTFNTLRYFPDGQKSCYNLLFYQEEGLYLFRCGFYYGDYDGLSKPPSFNLEIDGNLWTKVTTSMSEDEPIYHEMIYRINGESAQVCLVRTSDDEVPFISSLEATYFSYDQLDEFYRLMEYKTALVLHSRINYGANDSIGQLAQNSECCNRIWKPKQLSEYLNLADSTILPVSIDGENQPPAPVMATAIQAKNVTDSIYLSVNFSSQTTLVAYFVFYFRDPIYKNPELPIGSTVEIFIDNQKLRTTSIPSGYYSFNEYRVASIYPVEVINGSANITLSAGENSTLPPLLNAMEVFSVIIVSNVSMAPFLPKFSVAITLVGLHLLLTIICF